MMPQPMPVPTLTTSTSCDRPGDAHLPQGHDVHVVVDVDRALVAAERARDRVVVPARHDRRVRRPARSRTPPGRGRRRRRRTRPPGSARPRRAPSGPAGRPRPRTTSGPSAMSIGCPTVARICADRSVTATSTLVAPRSTASTQPARLLNCSSVGGRPPVLQPRPPSSRRLAAISWSTRALTVLRAAPVSATRSARLRARPVRTCRSSAPAEAEVWPRRHSDTREHPLRRPGRAPTPPG